MLIGILLHTWEVTALTGICPVAAEVFETTTKQHSLFIKKAIYR